MFIVKLYYARIKNLNVRMKLLVVKWAAAHGDAVPCPTPYAVPTTSIAVQRIQLAIWNSKSAKRSFHQCRSHCRKLLLQERSSLNDTARIAFGNVCISLQANQLICDQTSKQSCPDGTTCCQMESGDWGCCPMPNAVCCDDKIHCCPESTTCDVAAQKCSRNSNGLNIDWFEKFPARKNAQVNFLQKQRYKCCGY